MRGKVELLKGDKPEVEEVMLSRLRRIEERGTKVWVQGRLVRLTSDRNRLTIIEPQNGVGGSLPTK